MKPSRSIFRGLRFRLTVSYALFFTVLLGGVGMAFSAMLVESLEQNIRDVLDQEWLAMKGYLRIEKGEPTWSYDRDDPEENFIVARLQRIYLLADVKGNEIESSDMYGEIGVDSLAEIREVLASQKASYRIRRDAEGNEFLIRSGVVYSNDKKHLPYFVAIGRSLADNRRVIDRFTQYYVVLVPSLILVACVLGWLLAGRALKPVTDLARAAQRISGANLSLRIPSRQSGDELDGLIETFNRMIERLESSFQQIRQFSTDVSHELRTPITAIRGQLEVALFTARDTEQYRDAIVNALQDIERLSQIVRALLLLSQSESGQVTLQRSRVDVNATVRDVLEQFSIPAEEARVRLVPPPSTECLADVDPVQFERLVTNLMTNALKFTAPGGEVRVTLEEQRGRIEMAVEDTGCGIAAEHLPYIFDRFYRAPTPEPMGERGLGLGLSFVAWIAKAHGGSVEVTSEAGRGSRFVVALPAAGVEAQSPPVLPQDLADAIHR
ncbi:MAG: heavy metal sensor histidine kinase [Bryobacteraceae bacterium]